MNTWITLWLRRRGGIGIYGVDMDAAHTVAAIAALPGVPMHARQTRYLITCGPKCNPKCRPKRDPKHDPKHDPQRDPSRHS